MKKSFKLLLCLLILMTNITVIFAQDSIENSCQELNECLLEEAEMQNKSESDFEISLKDSIDNMTDLSNVDDKELINHEEGLDLLAESKSVVETYSENPSDFMTVTSSDIIGAFLDSTGNAYAFGYPKVTSDSSKTNLSLKITYTSKNSYFKDNLVQVQFYTLNNNVLEYVGATRFDTYGSDAGTLTSRIPYDTFKNQQYIYVTIGAIHSSYPSAFSGHLSFKVKNPYYEVPENTPTADAHVKRISKFSASQGLISYDGYSYVKGVNIPNQGDIIQKLKFINPYTGSQVMTFELSNYYSTAASKDPNHGNGQYNYDWAKFKGTVDISSLPVGEYLMKIYTNAKGYKYDEVINFHSSITDFSFTKNSKRFEFVREGNTLRLIVTKVETSTTPPTTDQSLHVKRISKFYETNGELYVDGYSYVKGVNIPNQADIIQKLKFVDTITGKQVSTYTLPNYYSTAASNDPNHGNGQYNYDWAKFKGTIDISSLPVGEYYIKVYTNAKGQKYDEIINFHSSINDFSFVVGNKTVYFRRVVVDGASTFKVTVQLSSYYGEGMYRVGKDIPAGEYYVENNSEYSGYYAVTSDANGNHILENDNFKTHTFITLEDGQYIELTRAKMTSAKNTPIFQFDNGVITEGMYRVGKDIPAGNYQAIATTSDSGYYALLNNSTVNRDIISNASFSTSRYVTLSNNQYLEITRAKLVPVY